MHEKTLTSRTVFSGRIVRLELQDVELEDGRTAYREIVRHPGAVGVLARRPDGRFLLVRQFRKPVEKLMLEVVAGILEPGEDPTEAARRELLEETGHRALRIVPMGTLYATPGYVDEKVAMFFAELDGVVEDRNLDEDERVEVVALTQAELLGLIAGGGVEDSKTLAAWTLFQALRPDP